MPFDTWGATIFPSTDLLTVQSSWTVSLSFCIVRANSRTFTQSAIEYRIYAAVFVCRALAKAMCTASVRARSCTTHIACTVCAG